MYIVSYKFNQFKVFVVLFSDSINLIIKFAKFFLHNWKDSGEKIYKLKFWDYMYMNDQFLIYLSI